MSQNKRRRTADRKARAKNPLGKDGGGASRLQADMGVLFVHGIGKQAAGETLKDFGRPVGEYVARHLSTAGAFGNLLERACTGCRVLGAHHHIEVDVLAVDGSPTRRKWIFAECYWDDIVDTVDPKAFNKWIWRVAPMLVLWQMISSTVGGFRRRLRGRQVWNPFSWFSFLCALFWNTWLRPPLALLAFMISRLVDYPEDSSRLTRREEAFWSVVANTLGDAHAFVAEGELSNQLEKRFRSSYAALKAEASTVAVIGHSQGGALAHRILKDGTSAPNLFVGVGSGLGILSAARFDTSRAPGIARSSAAIVCTALGWGAVSAAVFNLLALATQLLLISLSLVLLLFTGLGALGLGQLVHDLGYAVVVINGYGQLSQILAESARGWAALIFANAITTILAGGFAYFILRFSHHLFQAPKGLHSHGLPILGLPKERWLEIYSPLDPVSVGAEANIQATPIRVLNSTGWRIWKEHVAYFQPRADAVARIARELAHLGKVPLAAADLTRTSVWGRGRSALIESAFVIAWLVFYFTRVFPDAAN